MSGVVKFFELLLLAIGYLFHPFIFILSTFPLIVNLATAFVYSKSREIGLPSRSIFLPTVWSLPILAIGAGFANHGKPTTELSWPGDLVYVFLFLQLAHCIWLAVKNAGKRWMTIAVCLLLLIFGLTCTMMSLTSMSNQWE